VCKRVVNIFLNQKCFANLPLIEPTVFRENGAICTTTNTTNPVRLGVTNGEVQQPDTSNYVPRIKAVHVFVPKTPETFPYDADSNLLSYGWWNCTWDAENRLIRVQSRSDTPQTSWRRVEWQYDALGRRLRQTTWSWLVQSNLWVVTEDLKFVSDPLLYGRHVVDLNATNNVPLCSYVWGVDLSETMEAAGGVGGLLWVTLHPGSGAGAGTHFCAYDGNGNIVALSAASDGSATARYEYGPFAEPIRVTGPAAPLNPFRFSTKRTCNTTELVLYEYRAYNPVLGRWLSRDPIGEMGGWALYGFVGNSPITRIDPNGLKGTGIIGAFVDCGLSLLSDAVDKWLDQRLSCAEIAKRSRHGSVPDPGEPDSYDIDLCKGFSFQPNTFQPTYDPKSLAALLRDCIFKSLKGKAIEEALKDVTDEVKRKILAELLNEACDFKVVVHLSATVYAKCDGPRAVATVKYAITAQAGTLSMSENVKSLGPFGCPALDGDCCSCKHNPWKEKK
jgi:RHS repeat-associated protein